MKENFEERSNILLESVFKTISYRIESAMLDDDKNISRIVNDFSLDSNIKNIRILSPSGRVKYSNNKEDAGRDVNELTSINIFKTGSTKNKTVFSSADRKYLAISVLKNNASCKSCHKQGEILGYLNVESAASDAEVNFFTGIVHIMMLGVLVIFFLIVGFNKLYDIFINKPMNQFLEAITEVDRGNYQVRISHNKMDEFGKLSRHFNTMMDHLLQYRSEIEELTFQKLQHADRLVTLGELTAGIAHEINNNTAIIMTRADYLRLASQQDKSLQKYQEDLDVIIHQLELLSKITGETLKYSRKPSSAFAKINLIEILSTSAEMINPIAKKRGAQILKKFSQDDLFRIEGNFVQLEQVFTNLLGNALDAFEQGGIVTIEVNRQSDFFEVIISDNGKGIDEEIQKSIFLPFFTTKSEEDGTGLGLFIVKNICELHDIEIKCESQKNAGTKFFLKIKNNTGQL